MLPDGRFSTQAVRGTYLAPDNLQGYTRRVDYERAGIAIGDPSKGLNYQNWRAYYVTAERAVHLANDEGFDQVMFQSIGLTQLALSFDFNMRPVIAYTENGFTWIRHFVSDTVTNKYLIPSAAQPRLTLDDKRQANAVNADVCLFYLNGQNICVRYQRESWGTEHILARDVKGTRLGRVGMTTGWRVQLEMLP